MEINRVVKLKNEVWVQQALSAMIDKEIVVNHFGI